MRCELLNCPKCQRPVIARGGPEEWTPTFGDPDSGGNPYGIDCECGLHFEIGCVDYADFAKAWNDRSTLSDPTPLTLEEMRGMDGEPVWIVKYHEVLGDYAAAQPVGYWAIICGFDEDSFQMLAEYPIARTHDVRLYGNWWLAYSHKPKDSQRGGK